MGAEVKRRKKNKLFHYVNISLFTHIRGLLMFSCVNVLWVRLLRCGPLGLQYLISASGVVTANCFGYGIITLTEKVIAVFFLATWARLNILLTYCPLAKLNIKLTVVYIFIYLFIHSIHLESCFWPPYGCKSNIHSPFSLCFDLH